MDISQPTTLTLDAEEYADPLTAPAQALVPAGETTPAVQHGPLLNAIYRLAESKEVRMDVLTFLFDRQREEEDRQDEADFNDAMAACQAEITPIVKDAFNQQTRSSYAKLPAIDAVIKPVYTRHGFNVRHESETLANGSLRITCIVSRRRHTIRVYLDGPPDTVGIKGQANKTMLHGIKSTSTYLRNATLCMAFNLSLIDPGADDDGNAGGAAYLTAEQQERMLAALEASGKSEGKFLATMVSGVHSVEEVDQKDFDRLMNVLALAQKKAKDE